MEKEDFKRADLIVASSTTHASLSIFQANPTMSDKDQERNKTRQEIINIDPDVPQIYKYIYSLIQGKQFRIHLLLVTTILHLIVNKYSLLPSE